MAKINPIYTPSNSTEQQWVEHISKTLEKQIAIDIDHLPASIFHVPETITSEKPEAYNPRRLGLGPLNHFKPELYKMEQNKLTAVRRWLNKHKVVDFQGLIVDKIRRLVPVLRSSYDMYLDADDDTLAWVWSIDGVFLLHLLSTYSDGRPALVYLLESDFEAAKTGSEEDEIMEMSKGDETAQRFIVVSRESKSNMAVDANGRAATNGSVSDSERSRYMTVNTDKESDGYDRRKELIFDANGKEIKTRPDDETEMVDDSKMREVAKDVLMLENQIPYLVLKEIQECLKIELPFQDELPGNYDTVLLRSTFRRYLDAHSPLELCVTICPSVKRLFEDFMLCETDETVNSTLEQSHLLGILYMLITMNSEASVGWLCFGRLKYLEDAAEMENIWTVIGFIPGAQPFVNAIRLIINKLPWDKVADLIKKWFNVEKEASSVVEIGIPSASKLRDIAGVEFISMPRGGITEINFDVERRILKLPIITMKEDSEAILRNLVAYEISMARYGSNASQSNGFLLTEYVEFMCAMIDTPTDVCLLRDANIIQGELDDGEIVKIFNGISCQSNRKTAQPSDLQECISKMNKVFNDMPRVRTYGFMKRQVVILLKILGILSAITGIILLIREVYCQFYKCSSSFTVDIESISTVPSFLTYDEAGLLSGSNTQQV